MNENAARQPVLEEIDDDQSGIVCAVWRNPLGCLCGYAIVRGLPDHVAERLVADARACALDGSCHGGVTCAELCDEDHANEVNLRWGSAALVLPGDAVIGFNCMHAGDFMPDPLLPDAMPAETRDGMGTSMHAWTVDEVMSEARSLREAIHGHLRESEA